MSHMDVNDTSSSWAQRQACYANNRLFQNFNHNMMNFGEHTDGTRRHDKSYPPHGARRRRHQGHMLALKEPGPNALMSM